MKDWYAYDLDGTAAVYEGWKGVEHIGNPVPVVIELMKLQIAEGKDVRWFTARAWPIGVEKPVDWTEQEFLGRLLSAKTAVQYINDWSAQNLGVVIPVTCVKDFGMITLMDDRLIQVIPNTGKRADGCPLDPMAAAKKIALVLDSYAWMDYPRDDPEGEQLLLDLIAKELQCQP
jgi:hypothetical protein